MNAFFFALYTEINGYIDKYWLLPPGKSQRRFDYFDKIWDLAIVKIAKIDSGNLIKATI